MSTSFVHGKNTVLKIGTNDISDFTSNSQLERSADSHDVTAYGANSKSYNGGLLDATFSCEGTYDSTTTTGSRAVLSGIVGTTVSVTREPEGTGTGKPQEVVNVVITKYTETNAVEDMIKWSLEGQCSGDITVTTQA